MPLIVPVPTGAPSYAPTNLRGNYDRGNYLYNYKASNTRILAQGLAYAMSGGITSHLVMGDSVSDGGVSTVPAPTFDRTRSWPSAMRDQLATWGVPASGQGAVKVIDGGFQDLRFALSGTWANATYYASTTTVASFATYTLDRPANVVDVWYYDGATGTFTISVNGAASGNGFATVTGTGSAVWLKRRLTGFNLQIGATVRTTLTATGTSGFLLGAVRTWTIQGGFILDNISQSGAAATGTGASSWSDTTIGSLGALGNNMSGRQRVVTDGAVSNGSTTLTSATAAFTLNDVGEPIDILPPPTAGAPFPANAYIVAYLSATTVQINTASVVTLTGLSVGIGRDPSCIHIALGLNDMVNFGASAASITAAMTSIRNRYPKSDCILHLPAEIAYGNVALATQQLFQSAMYSLADTLDVPLYDWRDRVGPFATGQANGSYGDYFIHTSAATNVELGTNLAHVIGGGNFTPQTNNVPTSDNDLVKKAYLDVRAGRPVLGDHANPWFDVTQYGTVDKTGAVASTAAFAAAVAAIIASPRGGILYVPAGVYLVATGTIDFSAGAANPVGVIGADRALSVIVPTGTGDVIKFAAGADGASVQDIAIFSATPQTAGNAVNTNGCDDVLIMNCLFNNQFVDVNVNGTSIKVEITHTVHTQTNGSSTSVGILVANGLAGDTYIGPDVVMSNTGATRRAASVQVTQSGHFEINQANLTGSVQGLLVNPPAGQIVADGFFNASLFDSCTVNGVTLSASTATSVIKSFTFSNCWFAGTITGGGAGFVTSGTAGGIIDGVNFVGNRWLNNQTHGMQHGFGTNFRFVNNEVRGNSQAGSAANDGINIAANVSNWSIVNGKSGGTDQASTGGNQRYGINIASGTSTDYTITGMDCTGNVTGPILDGGTGTRKLIAYNVGGALPPTPLAAATAAINTTETVIAGAQTVVPAGALAVGSCYRIRVVGTCTSTLANLSTFTVRFGTAGTIADTSVGTFTCTAAASGTAIAFTAEAYFTVRSIGATGTAVVNGLINNNGVTGISAAAVVVGPSGAAPTATTISTTVASFLTLTYKSAATTTTSTFYQAFTEIVKA